MNNFEFHKKDSNHPHSYCIIDGVQYDKDINFSRLHGSDGSFRRYIYSPDTNNKSYIGIKKHKFYKNNHPISLYEEYERLNKIEHVNDSSGMSHYFETNSNKEYTDEYIAMPFCSGYSFEIYLRRMIKYIISSNNFRDLKMQRRMLREILKMTYPLSHIIMDFHRAHISHNDLVPSNIFISKDPSSTYTVRVIDLGKATGIGDNNVSVFDPGTEETPPNYFYAPEQDPNYRRHPEEQTPPSTVRTTEKQDVYMLTNLILRSIYYCYFWDMRYEESTDELLSSMSEITDNDRMYDFLYGCKIVNNASKISKLIHYHPQLFLPQLWPLLCRVSISDMREGFQKLNYPVVREVAELWNNLEQGADWIPENRYTTSAFQDIIKETLNEMGINVSDLAKTNPMEYSATYSQRPIIPHLNLSQLELPHHF